MAIYTQQQRPSYCFLACLESFLAEHDEIVTQDEIRAKTPSIFGQSPEDLGAFSPEFFCRVAEVWQLEVTALASGENHDLNDGSVFILCHWEGNANHPHWVRLVGIDHSFVYLMDPESYDRPRKIDLGLFRPWFKLLFRVRKKAEPDARANDSACHDLC